MFEHVSAKLGTMRKPQSFIVMPMSDGKIMIQSEGAEIYFRRIDLEPLK